MDVPIVGETLLILLRGWTADGRTVVTSLRVPSYIAALSYVEIRSAEYVYARYPFFRPTPEPEDEYDELGTEDEPPN